MKTLERTETPEGKEIELKYSEELGQVIVVYEVAEKDNLYIKKGQEFPVVITETFNKDILKDWEALKNGTKKTKDLKDKFQSDWMKKLIK